MIDPPGCGHSDPLVSGGESIGDWVAPIVQLLAEQGVVTREAIERHESTPEEQERVRGERDAFVQRLYGLLLRDTVKATPGNG